MAKGDKRKRGKSKGGRPQTPGAFYANGRRKQPTTGAGRDEAARTPPTPETQDYIDRRLSYWFVPGVWNLAAAEQCFDNAGILCATGWFNGHGFDAEMIRNAFREYGGLYWRWYAELAPKIAKHERVDRSDPGSHAASWERRFQKLDDRLPNGAMRRALHELCVDGWHFDEVHHHASALANLGRLKIIEQRKVGMTIVGKVAKEGDRAHEWLERALRGVFLLMDARVEEDIPLWRLKAA